MGRTQVGEVADGLWITQGAMMSSFGKYVL
jgi:hypothetical protein